MTKKITTTVSDELWEFRETYNIPWAEALRVGLSILLMERGASDFKNSLNSKRLKFLAERSD